MVDTADAQKAGRMPVHATGYGAHICGFIPDSEQIPNIWVSSAFTQKQKVLKPLRFQDFYWSEWRDLNSRPLDPQSSALPTALHPDIYLLLSLTGQLVYISMDFKKNQPLFLIFLIFC